MLTRTCCWRPRTQNIHIWPPGTSIEFYFYDIYLIGEGNHIHNEYFFHLFYLGNVEEDRDKEGWEDVGHHSGVGAVAHLQGPVQDWSEMRQMRHHYVGLILI